MVLGTDTCMVCTSCSFEWDMDTLKCRHLYIEDTFLCLSAMQWSPSMWTP